MYPSVAREPCWSGGSVIRRTAIVTSPPRLSTVRLYRPPALTGQHGDPGQRAQQLTENSFGCFRRAGCGENTATTANMMINNMGKLVSTP